MHRTSQLKRKSTAQATGTDLSQDTDQVTRTRVTRTRHVSGVLATSFTSSADAVVRRACIHSAQLLGTALCLQQRR
eukprot:m.125149 g.125149  ORF g.125149 m.125149 type:complete len:76 (+) comp16647_c0_seq2:132-359(+)